MKIINSIIGFLIIFLGCTVLSITVFNEELKTIAFKVIGFFIVVVGAFYLKSMAKLGKQ